VPAVVLEVTLPADQLQLEDRPQLEDHREVQVREGRLPEHPLPDRREAELLSHQPQAHP
jgi:hypothetical protein